ncbi:MAG: UDP-galactopyranose mutase [Solobacterium sp.]|nr:UDP-galactopyranose mutase [Solobacterium sp.]
MAYDAIIVGAGYAGAVSARWLAEDGKTVLVLEKRNHIGGNAYDRMDENGVRRHVYGPHLFHTNSKQAVDFLSRFTDWYPFEHRVLGWIEGQTVPVPFNLTSIEKLFAPEKAEHLKQELIKAYGMECKVPILELRKNEDPEIKELAEYIFEHVFKYYTMKQWGYTAEEIDPAVTARVPVHISYDDRYFQDTYQIMPAEGYTALFEKMLAHENITVRTGVDALDHVCVDTEAKKILFDGEVFAGDLIWTGLVDSLLGYRFGALPYRSLEFDVRTEKAGFQPAVTVNYPTPAEIHPYTRISDYGMMMQTPPAGYTTAACEYPYAYDGNAEKGNVPYYPVFTEDSKAQYSRYARELAKIPNLHLLGRLAEYRYYNMDSMTERALEFCRGLKH